MTGEFQFPDAPAIGGDSYEVAAWLERVHDHFQEMALHEQVDTMETLLRAFWEANPETTPERVLAMHRKSVEDEQDRAIQRRIETERMKDPAWIFEEDER